MNLENVKIAYMDIPEECKEQLRKTGITFIGEIQEALVKQLSAMDVMRGVNSACFEAITEQLKILTQDNL